jgi:hypothetical protein
VSIVRWNLKEAGCGNRLTTAKSSAERAEVLAAGR